MNATQLVNKVELFDATFPSLDDFIELAGNQLNSVFGDDCREKKINYETFRGIYFSYFPESEKDEEGFAIHGGFDDDNNEEENQGIHHEEHEGAVANAKMALQSLGMGTINEADSEEDDHADGINIDSYN